MKTLVVIALLGVVTARPGSRHRREAFVLPDGAELLLGTVKTTFRCPGDGYYADVDNDCKVFHICHDAFGPEGAAGHEMQHFSFLCGNQTMFNQLSLTCAYEDDAVPCENAKDFYYLNANIGDPKADFLSDNDIQRAAPLVPSLKAHDVLSVTAAPTAAPGPALALAPGLAPGLRVPTGVSPRTTGLRGPPCGVGRGAASEVKEVTVTAPTTTPLPPSTTQKEECVLSALLTRSSPHNAPLPHVRFGSTSSAWLQECRARSAQDRIQAWVSRLSSACDLTHR